MTTTLEDIRYLVEENIEDTLSNTKVINWSNLAQTEFALRVFVPGDTTLAINTTDLSYALSTNIRQIRRLRLQSEIDDDSNREYHPVYTFYNGNFEVPAPFDAEDTLLIDYYAHLLEFTAITDAITLEDRFKNLYTTFIESMYYTLPSTRKMIGEAAADQNYVRNFGFYNAIKKQVSDAYIIDNGIEKPKESGW